MTRADTHDFSCATCKDIIPRHYPAFLIFTSAADAVALKGHGLPEVRDRVFAFCNQDYKLFITSGMCRDHFTMSVAITGPYKFQHANPCRCAGCSDDARDALDKHRRP